jgi:Domain of unknown function (DUF4139)
MTIPCSSSIVDVAVYGRGAVVTRNIDLPGDLPDGSVDLEVSGITPLSEAGSVRAVLASPERNLVALQSSLFVPSEEAKPGPSVERVVDLSSKLERMESERVLLHAQRKRLEGMEPTSKAGQLLRAPRQRVEDGIAVSKTIDALLVQLDARILEVESGMVHTRRERDAAMLEDAQARSKDRMGTGHPSRRVMLRLDGTGPVDSLRMTYVVMAARWWPVYTLRLEEGGARATWWIEGLVAQLSGEDWTDVRLGLSTASLIADVRLPELPSLRIGRARPEPRRGFRPPPPDLDRMFASFDEAFAPPPAEEPATSYAAPVSMTSGDLDGFAEAEEDEVAHERARSTGRKQKKARLDAPAPLMARMPMAAPPAAGLHAAQPQVAKSAVLSTLEVPEFAAAQFGGVLEEQADEPAHVPAQEIEPSDAWLDFDGLRVADGMDVARRGRLFRSPAASFANEQQSALERVESLEPTPGICDPVDARGSFDHRYDAEGRAEVPSDGRAHRVALGSAQAKTQSLYRTVPVENAEVYRELSLTNPFDAPILDGPVDVYVDGSLLVTTGVGRIDRGGSLRVGLGVEDRIRVARNVRVEEETTGLLGGNTVVNHTVRIELRSSLGRSATIEVLDRIPDTDDRNVEVKFLSASQRASNYTQAERGAPIRGGLSWSVELAAGGTETLTYGYRINLPSKNEIVGGNRRD